MKTQIERVRLGDLRLLELNARFLRHETMAALVANIARDGCLTSVPLAWREPDGGLRVLSGNHRVVAAIEALGSDALADVMVTDDPLTPAQRTAIALSHNAIAGEDDPATLKLMYETLDDVDWRLYSGLDDKTLDLLAKVVPAPLGPERIEYLVCLFLLLPDERDRLTAAFHEAKARIEGATSSYLCRLADYDRLMDALDLAGRAYGIRNSAVALSLILDVFEAHLTDLSASWEPDEERQKWVPIASIFGADEIPQAAARIVQRAVAHLVETGDATEKARWMALEYWAADYLAGAQTEAAS